MRLERSFFEKPTLDVARDLLGKVIFIEDKRLIINETEAYFGLDDPASHAYKGLTKRTSIMFGPAGFSYVYLIYGMYHCLNFSTEKTGFPSAVLIRGGRDYQSGEAFSGPGKVCRYLGISKNSHNAIDIVISPSFYIEDHGLKAEYHTTPRIGIKVGLDKNWRFFSNL